MLSRVQSRPAEVFILGCPVPAGWRWFMKCPHHYTWQVEITPVLSGIDNKSTI